MPDCALPCPSDSDASPHPRLAAGSLRPREAVAAGGTGWALAMQPRYHPATPLPTLPAPGQRTTRERTTTDFFDSVPSKATTSTLAATTEAECACCLCQSWSIVGKPGSRMLGPEPLNSCSGNSWVGCRPPLQPHRLLSALDIPWEQPITRILLLRWLRSRIEEFSVGAGSLRLGCWPALLGAGPDLPPIWQKPLSPPGLSPSLSLSLLHHLSEIIIAGWPSSHCYCAPHE